MLLENHISASENGFVWSAYYAYSNHHHLTIRPEDVWFAIVIQLGSFINANSEKLRSHFVAHEGQKQLKVKELPNGSATQSVNFATFAQMMAGLISKNINDPELADWVMPTFSTTTDTDRTVAAVLFMGSMQKYFQYAFILACGIPSVTLLGEVSDWVEILGKLAKLEQLGDEPRQFAQMLRPILYHLILSFEQPNNPKVIKFWNTIATEDYLGSGASVLSGWITAFCFWNHEGKANKNLRKNVLDGVSYPIVATDCIPVGFTSVPVTVIAGDNQFNCVMLAGSFGIEAQRSDDKSPDGKGRDETPVPALVKVQPLSGWLMYEDKAREQSEAEKEETKALNYEGQQPLIDMARF